MLKARKPAGGFYTNSRDTAKTRLLDFRRPPKYPGDDPGSSKGPGTFDLLGFTHYWGKSRKGNWVIQRKTAKSRFSRAVKTIADWCRRNRHRPIREQWKALVLKLKGHYGYYGITGNHRALQRFREAAKRRWKDWLGRRSQTAKRSWAWFDRLQERYPLPPAVIAHSHLRYAANP